MRLYIIKVYFPRLFTVLLKNMLLNTSDNQCICIKPRKNFKKTLLKVWLLFIKPLLLHPLSRGKDITNEMMEQRWDAMRLRFDILSYYYYKRARRPRFNWCFFLPVLPERKKIKKNFRKNLVVKKKRFTFASAFTTKATVLWKTFDKQTM